MTQLPHDLAVALEPLIAALPLDRALGRVVVEGPPSDERVALVQSTLAKPEAKIIRDKPSLLAGVWLYADDLDRSHKISQSDESDPTLSYWHGIMHRLEGDFSNSHYWFRRVGVHPAMARVGAGYDPHALIDKAEAAFNAKQPADDLLALQRREWATLMQWCAEQA